MTEKEVPGMSQNLIGLMTDQKKLNGAKAIEKLRIQPISRAFRINIEWFRFLFQEELTNEDWHSHSGVEIHFLWAGQQTYLFSDREIHLQEGEALLIPPGTVHRLIPSPEKTPPFLRCVLNFTLWGADQDPEGRFLSEALLIEELWQMTIREEVISEIRSIVLEASDRKAGYLSVIEAHVIRLLFLLARQRTGEPAADYSVRQIRSASSRTAGDIQAYIENNALHGLLVSTVANKMHMSTRQLERVFQREYGLTVYQKIEQTILTKAKNMLQESSAGIGDIALQLGFSTAQGFSNFFKAKEGQTPTAYRMGVLSED